MPVLQQQGPFGAIGDVLGTAASIYGAVQKNKRQKELDAQTKAIQDASVAYQKWLMQNGDKQTQISATKAGLVPDANGNYVNDPRIAGILAGSAQTATSGQNGAAPPAAKPGQPAQPQQPGQIEPNSPQSFAANAQHYLTLAQRAEDQIAQIAAINPNDPHLAILKDQVTNYRNTAQNLWQQYGRAVGAATKATEDAAKHTKENNIAAFEKGLHDMPGNLSPQDQIKYLNKQIAAARRVDDKDFITNAQRQIGEIQNSLNQNRLAEQFAKNFNQRQQFHIDVRTGTGNAPSSAADAVYQRAMAAKTPQEALRIIDDPKNGLNYRERTELRQSIKDQKPDPTKKTTDETVNANFAKTVLQRPSVMQLPAGDQADLDTNITKYGYNVVKNHLTDLATGKAQDPSTPPDRARRILGALGERI